MVDLAPSIEFRNYGLKRTTEPKAMWDSLKVILPLLIIAGALSFHIWVQSQSIDIGYQSQQLKTQEEEFLRIRQQLILEEETAKNLASLEKIARNELGMVPVKAAQIIPAPMENLNTAGQDKLALGSFNSSLGSKKSSALN
jgi:cell division protein FtsL